MRLFIRFVAVFVAVLALGLAVATVAQSAPTSGAKSSSSSSSSSKSSSSSSSSKSSSSGYKSSSGKSYNKAAVAQARPKASKPSSGKKQQPGTAADLIPSRFAVKKGPAGRSYDADAAFLRRNPTYLDPYSPRYYGHSPSVYYYLYLAALSDDDDDDPIRPQDCDEYDADVEVCLDDIDQDSGGSGCSSFVIWPWMLFGGGGLAVMKRRLRGSA
jgi:hypothetical protein